MKLFILLLVSVISFSATCFGENELSRDFDEFFDLIPREEFDAITLKYMENEEFVAVMLYSLYDEEFKQIMLDIENLPEFVEILKYLEDSGFEAFNYFDTVNEIIGLPPIDRPKELPVVSSRAKNIVGQCRDEVRAILPKAEIASLHNQKMADSPAFLFFAQRLETEELEVIMKNFRATQLYIDSSQTLLENGLDFYDSMVFYLELLGFRELPFYKYFS